MLWKKGVLCIVYGKRVYCVWKNGMEKFCSTFYLKKGVLCIASESTEEAASSNPSYALNSPR